MGLRRLSSRRAALVALALSLPAAAAGQGALRIPESIRAEHAEITTELQRATRASGRVGQAARELAAVLRPHFEREEQIALPPLALLEPLARGPAAPPAMRRVLPMTDSLRAEMPRMLREHVAIRAAVGRMRRAAEDAGDREVARLAERLAQHARTEEEVLYPAAVLVGEVVRGRSAQQPRRMN